MYIKKDIWISTVTNKLYFGWVSTRYSKRQLTLGRWSLGRDFASLASAIGRVPMGCYFHLANNHESISDGVAGEVPGLVAVHGYALALLRNSGRARTPSRRNGRTGGLLLWPSSR